MYHKHFGLKRSPFSIEPDPAFLWLSAHHREGLSVLQCGIRETKGFLLLTGEEGTGKTVLVRRLITGLPPNVAAATIPDPSLALSDFYNILASELGMGPSIRSKAEFWSKLKKFGRSMHASSKRLLLVIDEAQRLTNDLLEEIRLLADLSYGSRKLITPFFVGQIEFLKVVLDSSNQALRQRITVIHHLAPLSPDETGGYIRHRLRVAGTEKEIFTPEAIQEVFRFSNGTPRRVNILCNRALIAGCLRGCERVSPELVRECSREPDLPVAVGKPELAGNPLRERPSSVQARVYRDEASGKASANGRRWRRWTPAAVLGAATVLVLGYFFIRAPVEDRPRASVPAEERAVEIRSEIETAARHATLASAIGAPDSRKSRRPPEKGYDKKAVEGPRTGTKLPGASDEPVAFAHSRAPEVLEKPPAADLPLPDAAGPLLGRVPVPENGKTTSADESAPALGDAKTRRFQVFFKPGSAELEDSSYAILKQVSDFLTANPQAGITLSTSASHDARPGLSAKLLALRVTSIRSALAAQPLFTGKITVADSDGQENTEGHDSAGGKVSRPWAEIRVEPGVQSQVPD